MLKFFRKQYIANVRIILSFVILITISSVGNAESVDKNRGAAINKPVASSPVNGQNYLDGKNSDIESSHPIRKNGFPDINDLPKKNYAIEGKKPDIKLRVKLHKAFKDKDYKSVFFIQDGNPDLVHSVDENNTPFFKHAVDSRLIGVIRGFLDDGADPDTRIENNMTLLIRECKDSQDTTIARFLIEYGKASVNVEDDYGITPLGYAVKRKRFDLVKLLVSNGANVNCKNESVCPVLLTASCLDDSKIALYLINHGARLDFKTKEGYTPLHGVKNDELARYLLAKGLDPNAGDILGNTPLHWLATHYNRETDLARAETAKILVSGGANVNEKNSEGKTPLHNAVNFGFIHLTKYLVLKGAKVDTRDNSGKTPLGIAIEHRNYWQFGILFSGYLKQHPEIKLIILFIAGYGLFYIIRKHFPGNRERKMGKANS